MYDNGSDELDPKSAFWTTTGLVLVLAFLAMDFFALTTIMAALGVFACVCAVIYVVRKWFRMRKAFTGPGIPKAGLRGLTYSGHGNLARQIPYEAILSAHFDEGKDPYVRIEVSFALRGARNKENTQVIEWSAGEHREELAVLKRELFTRMPSRVTFSLNDASSGYPNDKGEPAS